MDRKRLREAGFKTIDLKAGYGFHQENDGEGQAGPSGSLTQWLRSAKPKSYVLIAARVKDDGDLNRMITDTTSMTQIMDGMGLFCFTASDPTSSAPSYSAAKIPPVVQLGRILHDIGEQMRDSSD